MSLYVRVNTNFYGNRKTAHLCALIGNDAFWVPPRIWAYAATNQPDGDLSKYPPQVLANLIGYTGDASRMLEALLEVGFLDADPLRIHDWNEHNSYHVSFAERAKAAADARWSKRRNKAEIGEEKRREDTSIASSNATSIEISGALPNPKALAVLVLTYLNEKAGRNYRQLPEYLKSIEARLESVQFDVDGVKQMIDRQVALWAGDSVMDKCLNPTTLFRKSNFPVYYDDRSREVRTSKPPSPKAASTFDIRHMIQVKTEAMSVLKRRHYSETQTLSGGQWLAPGWRDEGAKAEYVKLKAEVKDLNDQLSKLL